MVVAIGWTGQWRASFGRDGPDRLSARAGMATTRLRLRPGEEIRTPKILTLFWQGERMRGNNLLRRFLLAHHRPHPGGKPLVLPVLVGSWGGTSAAEHLKTIQRVIRHDLPIELYWIDAEWFGRAPWFTSNGNWLVRKDLYPGGFQALSEPLHRSGRKLLLWFEPQRVCEGTPWAKFQDRHGWLLRLTKGTPEYQQRNMNWGVPHQDPRWVLWESRRSQITAGDRLWNMGEPAARRFLTDWLSARIDEFGLDWYREDFNIAPLEYWQEADPPDRRGVTEIRYVEGLYAMWDELLARHPHLAIDNCASGGRRIDLETIGRATALWRTDWPVDAIHRQCHTFGLMSWVPLHMSDGTVLEKGNEYEIRSAMSAGLNVKLSAKDDEASDRQAKALIDQYLNLRRFYYGDYYPLTAYSQSQDVWMAYQLHLPESDEGLVVAFRRPGCPEESHTLRLHGLAPGTVYQFTDLDTGKTQAVLGAAVMGQGLPVRIPGSPGSALVRYGRASP
jgi:alpha-galactosidase